MKSTLFQISKKIVLPQFLKNLLNDIDMSLACILDVNQNVIQVNN